MIYSIKRNTSGFTIIELMIATIVFSVILLIATYGILNVGRIYRKSLTSNQVQQTTRAIIDTVTQNIKFNGGSFAAGNNVYCLGNSKRLSINPNVQFVSNATHGLVLENITCTNPPTSLNFASFPSGAKELLGPRMRVVNFYICYPNMTPTPPDCTDSIVQGLGTSLYYVYIRVISGDSDLIQNNTCTLAAGRQFCAVSELSAYVQKVIQ